MISLIIFADKLKCGGNITSVNGTITSLWYPMHYPNNLNCTWIIELANVKVISMSFVEFQTEPYWDYVWIYDGISLESSSYYTGYPSLPLEIVSSGNMVMIQFTTDGSGTATGFSMSYEGLQGVETTTEVVPKPECCPKVSLTFTPGNDQVYNVLARFFTDYALEYNLLNGHSHWTSVDGLEAIWDLVLGDLGAWLIGSSEYRGTSTAYMYTMSEAECVHDTKDEDWNYWSGNQWESAGEGAFVECFTGMYLQINKIK